MAHTATATKNTVTRLDIPTGRDFDEFIAAFEAAVPPFDLPRIKEIAAAGGTWDEVERAVAENAPNGFVVFGTVDGQVLMSIAGHRRKAIQYLMGNHVIAERMYRHHPDAVLYAPPRVLIYEGDDGNAVFVTDQPSTVFAGLGVAAVTAVGFELDGKFAQLLRLLGVTVPKELESA
ncbi:DUF302 domain-containing protein [Actinacidiphila rubida]|uniref:DUF302 domain-containing protein n=1 Tax=Actinacidiphila rubida TaxID=310780 RepID=A0A1H8TBK0_9ACTN|nr:DUF302 domain-containing protein [Actinacidiphila rubida]SEO87878.1 protein of unknown function DUF302 [Actinacidiphila rubida]